MLAIFPSVMSHLVSCGSNSAGQLGTGDVDDHHAFQHCTFLGSSMRGHTPRGTKRILDIACGANHTLVLLERSLDPCAPSSLATNELWVAGDGRRGQLATAEFIRQTSADFEPGENSSVFRPVDFGFDPAIRKVILEGTMKPKLVCAAWETTYIVFEGEDRDDLLVSMGSNDWGCLGIGNDETPLNAKPVEKVRIIDLTQRIPKTGRLKIVSIKSGPHHILAQICIMSSDSARSHTEVTLGWGKSRHGQLGSEHRAEFTSRNNVNSPRRVSNPSVSRARFAIGAQHTAFLSSDGSLTGMGCNKKGQQQLLNEITRYPATIVTQIDCTWNGTYALCRWKDTISLIASGAWEKGQLGRGEAEKGTAGKIDFPDGIQPSSIACGTEHVMACCVASIARRKEVWGWGWNEHGNLGLGETHDVWSPVRIWPTSSVEEAGKMVAGIWAGSATSWISFDEVQN